MKIYHHISTTSVCKTCTPHVPYCIEDISQKLLTGPNAINAAETLRSRKVVACIHLPKVAIKLIENLIKTCYIFTFLFVLLNLQPFVVYYARIEII